MLEFLCLPALRVLEIGPGGGVLTRQLSAQASSVLAVELDREWAFTLEREMRGSRVTLWIGDALELPWERLPAGISVTGNLPYGVATRLIELWLDQAPRLGRAGFLVQFEVALRLCAPPGGREYGALSALVAARAQASLLARVPPGSFRPPPRVDSAFVGLEPGPERVSAAEWPEFKSTLHAAFRHRRKTLARSLESSWGRAAARRALEQAGLDARRRAETLSVDELVALHRAHAAR